MRPTRFRCATRAPVCHPPTAVACLAGLLSALMLAGTAQACQVIGMQPGGQPICANHNAPAQAAAVYFPPEALVRFEKFQRAAAGADTLFERERLRADPDHRRYMEGAWTHFDPGPSADGQPRHCGAMFSKQGRVLMLNGNADPGSMAMLTMLDLDPERSRIPRAQAPRLLEVALDQTGAPRAVLSAWNHEMGGRGAITFAVPSLRAGVDGLTDTLRTRVHAGGHEIFDLEYHGGARAQARLRDCMRQ